MRKTYRLFLFSALVLPATIAVANAATCSRANLTRCLDSACAINIGANPAARCQLCGTSSAGTASTSGMRNLTVGASSSNTLSATQLKSAPNDPGARYAWATGECLKKISGCTQDDVTTIYDPLIEQSCRAAGINADRATLFEQARKTKSQASCDSEIRICLMAENKCGTDMTACSEDADFDLFFSACTIQIGGCGDYVTQLRTDMQALRDSTIKNLDDIMIRVANTYQTNRETTLQAATDSCVNNQARESCVATICANNMKNKCAPDWQSERSMAEQLCKYHDIACDRLKR